MLFKVVPVPSSPRSGNLPLKVRSFHKEAGNKDKSVTAEQNKDASVIVDQATKTLA